MNLFLLMFLLAFFVPGLCAFSRRSLSRAFSYKVVFGGRRRHGPIDVGQAIDGETIIALISYGDICLAARFVGITGDRIRRAEIARRVCLSRNDRAFFHLLLQRLVGFVFK